MPTLAVQDGGAEFGLSPVMPNPARGASTLRFGLPREGRVRLAIHDVSGSRVRTLLEESRRAGTYSLRWDGRDDQGRAVAAGVHFSRLEHGGRRAEQRLVILR